MWYCMSVDNCFVLSMLNCFFSQSSYRSDNTVTTVTVGTKCDALTYNDLDVRGPTHIQTDRLILATCLPYNELLNIHTSLYPLWVPAGNKGNHARWSCLFCLRAYLTNITTATAVVTMATRVRLTCAQHGCDSHAVFCVLTRARAGVMSKNKLEFLQLQRRSHNNRNTT